ncbi:hypothetical protein JJJ17_07765 [Paracoccus caeni]|uniref:Uncharacterized protein n=1 Tax=Paracoccus caeni TaxID=657651 RepID=A0A934SDC9_9RHOB|nr:hypothetical protein [Paracoccus caeni]MBK4215817.1 hypothetical protein [Paracoccus caeni]
MRHSSQSEMMPTLKTDSEQIKAVRLNIKLCKRKIRLEEQRLGILRQRLIQLTADDESRSAT